MIFILPVNAVHISNGNFAWGIKEDDAVTLKELLFVFF